MHRSLLIIVVAFGLCTEVDAQEVTGLSGWDIFLDPGHSQNENVGVFGYSEAHKVLRVGLALRELLLETTDIDTVYISRTNDRVDVELVQRVDFANSVAASHFHSIHSNAAGPTANFEFILWPQYKDGTEAVPNGGKLMSELMSPLLSGGMRIDSRGAIGECDFYGVERCRGRDLGAGKGGSRNFVQSFTDMPSELSEAGFHTNPTQNQRNMNADWKRLEAQAMYWGILDYHGLERPTAHIATGIIYNLESGRPINGAVVTVGDTSYVTDTYESLFHRYSNDPDQLRNGFYYLDGLSDGTHPVSVAAEGYEPFEGEISMVNGFFTFEDAALISTAAPTVVATLPLSGEERHRILDPIVIDFSRPMDQTTVESAFSISPHAEGNFQWGQNDTRLIFRPDTLLPETDYIVTIDESARGAFEHEFDGDVDGEAGGVFDLSFTTGPPDAVAPQIKQTYPAVRQSEVERRPVITMVFDEELNPATVTPARATLEPASGGDAVPGEFEHYVVNDRSLVSFFPDVELAGGVFYVFHLEPGVEDISGNAITSRKSLRFSTRSETVSTVVIDSFEPSEDGTWWQPQESGSTIGIVTDSTAFLTDSEIVNHLSNSTLSRRLDYGWDDQTANPLIREHLAGGLARSIWFDAEQILQVYLFGDGSGTRFRFAVDDQNGHEVSPWITVDWLGWRLVSWDLSEGELGSWIGDGKLDPPLRIDSFQLTSGDSDVRFGSLWFDDLRLAELESPVAVEPRTDELPEGLELYQNYPNPFNRATTFRFVTSEAGPVTLTVFNSLGAVVATPHDNQTVPAGRHEISWDALDLPNGVYFARLQVGRSSTTIKIVRLQ